VVLPKLDFPIHGFTSPNDGLQNIVPKVVRDQYWQNVTKKNTAEMRTFVCIGTVFYGTRTTPNKTR
jgi:hypothetical protein